MVAYNFTIDDTSPMIEYTGTWIHKHPEGKPPPRTTHRKDGQKRLMADNVCRCDWQIQKSANILTRTLRIPERRVIQPS